MARAAFDDLRVIRREHESQVGCSEVCQRPGGELCIRLCIRDSECQKAYLSGRGKGNIRLERGVLEVLLPYRDGSLFYTWAEQEKGLGQRREACLSLVAQCVEAKAAPCVAALSARIENLRFNGQTAWLQFLPDWGRWSPETGPGSDVAAVAALCRCLLTYGDARLRARRYPWELRLLCARQELGGYQTWSQLQRDLSAIPDELLPLARPYRVLARHLTDRVKRFVKPAACVMLALLLSAALISLAGACRTWRSQQQNAWPGMTVIGDQRLYGG